ncbi:hypothetical protein A3F07_01705 [candidate division WWE3 bacterium RIFCSPHIGHO2_12_FULL_38_15]|uniref:Uncharacterized protein n=1 Tax=candidate division WWE3 bacterium RIFCSPHIGHO2_02_FULL_38_14 TaxID=1802620 RepID=A0A1F4V8T4_UNCKA|nr:MAG: hypothetical protein A2793_01595 [candidate division WWE3 bacterium RIFCSPHIGHO2_01_FULL_38_45]OGC48419.1 MAG: hypothetical protein A3F07_01705 [candidate division WWE3 bacterium RIFCSPHIGHO2_12_FULL_38_15]OGC53606.1 MAG: hypothetical protein A3D91_04150 [candidate division WWE3 bacterium RIFCSPHIGHO2_02_FULL_38_14]OGC54352.1 MAG: hypothetical protein A3B64_02500 [candidate division WWE3 bacterium RIFCSPLOWO2_01_FULL_37_24]HLB51597.1 hypothetical protein [Patescibacteria group bacterium
MEQYKVGELLIRDKSENNALTLLYIDAEPEPGKQGAYYTQIAHVEDYGEGKEVYLEFESGSIPFKFIAGRATDEDIKEVVEETLKSDNAKEILNQWKEKIEEDKILLETEKQRIVHIVNNSLI